MESPSIPLPGSQNFSSTLYSYVASRPAHFVDRHVFTCILFCLLGRHTSPDQHLLLRTSRPEVRRLRQMVVAILSQILGLSTVHIRCRKTTTAESLVAEILSSSKSAETSTPRGSAHARRKGSINQKLAPQSRSRPGPSSLSSARYIQQRRATADREDDSIGLPQALVVSSLGRTSHEIQEHFYEIMRTGRVTSNSDQFYLPVEFLVVALDDMGDGRETPNIATCLLDRFTFSSYVEAAAIDHQAVASSPDSYPIIPREYLSTLSRLPLPSNTPFLDTYTGNLLVATFQHPLLSCPFFDPRTRDAFRHFARVSSLMFSGVERLLVSQEDIDKTYVHVIGHRVSIRRVGEGLLGILDRTAVPLPNEDKCWMPGMKRRETIAQLLRDILMSFN